MIAYIQEKISQEGKMDRATLDSGERIVKLDSKMTQNDIELYMTRKAIRQFHGLVESLKAMTFNQSEQTGLKREVVKNALKQIEPFEGVITQAYSQVLDYRAEGQEIPAYRLLQDIKQALEKDISRLDHLTAIVTNHSLSERNFEQIKELVGIEVICSAPIPNRKSMISQVDSLMQIR